MSFRSRPENLYPDPEKENKNSMRINIAASHRFHLLDLARELESLGHDVRFYSYVPTKRALRYGLKKESSFSLFYLMIPFLVLTKLSNRKSWSIKLINWALDTYLTLFMKPCDVYIALGTVYKKSLIGAKKKFNAVTILEWGSKHINEQSEILNEVPGMLKQEDWIIRRSLDGYMFADYISIPSQHSLDSFIAQGIQKEKLLKNHYGVDLKMFKPTKLSGNKTFDVIMVGGWSYVKGCDLLIEFFKKSNLTFLHVGSIGNLDFPDLKNMTHIDSVDQAQLINYYSTAKIFVLPSRTEGFGMVLSQAMICGLPIVCSKNTGGPDLKLFLEDKDWIIELNAFTIQALEDSIKKALLLADKQTGIRSYVTNISNSLDWKSYGVRYNENLENICIDVK